MTRKAGGNLDAIRDAVKNGADALKDGVKHEEGAKPPVAEAADKVFSQLKGAKGQFSLNVLKEQATKENGVMAGGAVVAADGIRRAVTKDDDGKRHIIRGAVQTAVGAGAFAAALTAKRGNGEGFER